MNDVFCVFARLGCCREAEIYLKTKKKLEISSAIKRIIEIRTQNFKLKQFNVI